MKITTSISVFIILLYVNYSCGKPKEDELVEFKFEIPLTITPVKNTFNIGDTLVLEASFSDSIKEALSGKYYKVPNFDFQTYITFLKLVSKDFILAEQPGGSANFEIISEVGDVLNLGQTGGSLKLNYTSQYKCRIKIIAKQKGIYSIYFLSNYVGNNTPLDFINLGSSASGGQKKATLRNIWYVINDGNNNFDLLKEHCRIAHLTSNPSPDNVNSERYATFTFVVQ